MRLLTWNVHSFRDAIGRYVAPRVVEALAALPADVLALQEVDSLAHPSAARLPLDALADAYPYQRVTYTIEHRWRRYGHALLSRIPLHEDGEHDVRYGGLEIRRLLDAQVDVEPECRMRVIAAHLDLAPWARGAQLRRIAEIVATRDLPTVVVGDLNVWTAHAIRRRVGPDLVLLPSPPTFPAHRPWIALDRVLCRPSELVRSVAIAPLPRELSDHLALLVELG